jgi:hypothetical protein
MAQRIRKTRKYGNTSVITLKPNDAEDMNIKIGKDFVDIQEIKIIKHKKKKK